MASSKHKRQYMDAYDRPLSFSVAFENVQRVMSAFPSLDIVGVHWAWFRRFSACAQGDLQAQQGRGERELRQKGQARAATQIAHHEAGETAPLSPAAEGTPMYREEGQGCSAAALASKGLGRSPAVWESCKQRGRFESALRLVQDRAQTELAAAQAQGAVMASRHAGGSESPQPTLPCRVWPD